jgi:hypothetical protein
MERYFYRASAEDFKKIPGSPIAYWLSKTKLELFADNRNQLASKFQLREGLTTGDNDTFLREWFEVNVNDISLERQEVHNSEKKWSAHRKGGGYRKWFGNNDKVLLWQHDGKRLKETGKCVLRAEEHYFKPALSWSRVSSGKFCIRYYEAGQTFDSTSPSIIGIGQHQVLPTLAAFLNSPVTHDLLRALSPTLDFRLTNMGRLPFLRPNEDEVRKVSSASRKLVDFAMSDWDAYETSWDFISLPLLNPDYRQPILKSTYQNLRAHWQEMTLEMQRLEEENNRIFIDAYGLQDELTPEVPLKEITLTCNPHYRYQFSGQWLVASDQEKEEELEKRLLEDTMKEFISYGVGCMFGRYSLDAPGLILANQGEGLDDYWRIVEGKRGRPDSHQLSAISNQQEKPFTDGCKLTAEGSSTGFQPDEDNVIPILDGDWFMDEIAGRFRAFLRLTFGAERVDENLKFLEEAIGKDIRKYFLKDFYTDHVKRYKKRPIYWLFSSPQGTFNALIYMHRYRPDTVSIILNDYLREFRTKLTSHKNHLEAVSISGSASQSEKTQALKEIEKITRMIAEMEEYEREVLYPLATQQVEIDLDDGVKVNYPKLGAALKKIPCLESKKD